MKTDLKVKYLQYLNEKKQDEGFTLIELLVVIIIIGILAAIALPSFLNQANKAKQSEAKQYVGSMNRTQQAYFLENNYFTTEIGKLGLGIRTQTENYSYTIVGRATGGGTGYTSATNNGVPIEAKLATLKTYVGGVVTDTVTSTSEATTIAILCESDKPGTAAKEVEPPATAGNGTSCPANYASLSK